MKLAWRYGLAPLAILAAFGATPDPAGFVSTEDFARPPLYSDMKLSPDGAHLAFLREFEGDPWLYFAELNAKKVARVNPGYEPGSGAQRYIRSFQWIGDRRIIFTAWFWDTYMSGVTAVDCDGENFVPLSGLYASRDHPLFAWNTIYSFNDNRRILMLDQHTNDGEIVLYPDVVQVDTMRGSARTVTENPGNVIEWGVDRTGAVRFGATYLGGDDCGMIYRESDREPWRTLPSIKNTSGRIMVLGFDYSGQKLFVGALSAKRRRALYSVDPASLTKSEAILEDPEYDVIPAVDAPGIYTQRLSSLVFSKTKRSLAGVYYTTEGPRSVWLDADFSKIQRAIDKAFPNTVNRITSGTKDDKRFLVISYSDREPGFYSLLDTTTWTLTRLMSRMAWIKPDLMAQMYPIHYRARDGLLIHGYLTVPRNRKPKSLPLVVMPHGGPWIRDVWGFDPLVQMLANRGYAVLQMNYRGSIGYGADFSEIARREIGCKIQDDIEDGARWAVAEGLADRRRLAILGASYGGYSALFALAHDPDFYRCGISIAGVTDWFSLIKGKTDGEQKFAVQYWIEQIGNPKHDSAFLKAISPINLADKITAPVLIIQGNDDRVVPPIQAKSMITALEKAGHRPESLFLENEGHGFGGEKSRIEVFRRIEAFLATNIGPAAPLTDQSEIEATKATEEPARK